jgi:hypothetical protein
MSDYPLFPKPEYKFFSSDEWQVPIEHEDLLEKIELENFIPDELVKLLGELAAREDVEAIFEVWTSVFQGKLGFPGFMLASVEVSIPEELSPTQAPMAANMWNALGVVVTTNQKHLCELEYNSATSDSSFSVLQSFPKDDYVDWEEQYVVAWRRKQMEAYLDSNIDFCYKFYYSGNPIFQI